jgi:dynein heavy chain
VAARLQEFRDLVKDVVASACRTRLFEAGFVPDDFLHPTDSAAGIENSLFIPLLAQSFVFHR